jgi:hypothetical protein
VSGGTVQFPASLENHMEKKRFVLPNNIETMLPNNAKNGSNVKKPLM